MKNKKIELSELIALSQMFGLGIDPGTGHPKFYRIASDGLKKIKYKDKQADSLSKLYQDEN